MSKTKYLWNANPVMIEWVDSMFSGGRKFRVEEAETKCVSIGHLLSRSKKNIMIVQSLSEDAIGEVLTIPVCSVTRVRRLKT